MKNFLKIHKYKKKINCLISADKRFKAENLCFKSFNGRSISMSFIDSYTGDKFFIKQFIKKESGYEGISITNFVNKKYYLVDILRDAGLLSYSSYKLKNICDVYMRDYLSGVNAAEYLKNLNESDFEKKSSELLLYLNKVMTAMRRNKLFVCLDLRLENFIILNDGTINIIDLDLTYIKLNSEDFEGNLYSKFFSNAITSLSHTQQLILFKVMEAELSGFPKIKKTLVNIFYSDDNESLDRFVLSNHKYFLNNSSYSFFSNEIGIKAKLTETLLNLPKRSYIVARRYDWLLDNSNFNSKDIDIFCEEYAILSIQKVFESYGWDVYNGKISQFFESQNLLVTIDLRSDVENRYQIKFDEILDNVDIVDGVNIIDSYYYHYIMLSNFFNFKKYMKDDYYKKLTLYLQGGNSQKLSKYKYLCAKKVYKYDGKVYFSLWRKYRSFLSNFLNHKDFVFIGADGAGKSTLAEIVGNNISLVVSSKIKYLGGFYYPSGRTDLFFHKTSIVFYVLKYIKDFVFIRLRSLSRTQSKESYEHISSTKRKKVNTWRSMSTLNKAYVQFLLTLFLPVLILDCWIHKLYFRVTPYRVYIYDRYYDDIFINYTYPFVRHITKYLIPTSKYKFYLYSMPEEHFNRKHDEDIEMILHMQNCYTESANYLINLPTNIEKSFLNKKIVTMALFSL
jgi:hypothetical protein